MIKEQIQLSREFKNQANKAVASIVLFVIVYLIIIAFAFALTALSVFGGIMLIVSFPHFITLALGIGLASLGLMVLIFLFKFIFKPNKADFSHLKRISKKDEPKLFELIEAIVVEVGTTFPKKVFLSADVNAGVFYNSNFWSMFFPVRKNLQIGMGLVNSISLEELKAILAHEFGHFSQKSMKVGSYVYNVNQAIYNMLYDNDSYDNMIQKWARLSGYFSIFVLLAIKIIQVIQWILKKMYDLVNKSYMALSREMEFHADEIAANVTGYLPLKNSLCRMGLADHAYHSVLSYYERKIAENIKSENIYKEQEFVIRFLAKEDGLPFSGSFPNISLDDINKFNKSKLVIKDQWASHPSLEERIDRLEQCEIKSKNEDKSPANSILTNIEERQKEVTDILFQSVQFTGEVRLNPLDKFEKDFIIEFRENTFDDIFNGYYDNKNPLPFDLEKESAVIVDNINAEQLFSESKVNDVYSAIALQNDIEVLNKIASKEFKIKSFDYNGKKYSRKESHALVMRLKKEQENLNEMIKSHDILIYQFFISRENAQHGNSKLKALYQEFFTADQNYDEKFEIYSKLSKATDFINFVTPSDQINKNFYYVKKLENDFKVAIQVLEEDELYSAALTDEIKQNFDQYLSKDWRYFDDERYNEENLHIFFTAMNNYYYLLSRGYFLLKKRLLDYKVSLLNPAYQKVQSVS